MEYKSNRFIDGKIIHVIVDESRKIVNRNPSKKDLEGLEEEPCKKKVRICCNCDSHYSYVDSKGYEVWFKHRCQKAVCTGYLCRNCYQRNPIKIRKIRTCCNCKSHDTYLDSNGYENWCKCKCKKDDCTKYLCNKCYQKNDRLERYKIGQRRNGDLDSNSSHAKGDKTQKLINTLENFEDLNKKFDNYRTSIDSIDSITGLKYQIRGVICSVIEMWPFSSLEAEWSKKYHSMFCVCKSRDEKTIDRIYKFPKEELIGRKGFAIVKNPTKGEQWYEKYRIKDKEYIKKANKIWQEY